MSKVRLAIILSSILAAFSSGWYIASTIAENEALAAREEAQNEIDQARDRAYEAERQLANIKPEIREKIKVVTKKVVEYVPSDDCSFDDEWVRLANESAEAANTASRPNERAVQD